MIILFHSLSKSTKYGNLVLQQNTHEIFISTIQTWCLFSTIQTWGVHKHLGCKIQCKYISYSNGHFFLVVIIKINNFKY